MPSAFDPREFRSLVSGSRRGAVASLLRGGLGLAERPYRWAVARRNRWYDAHPEAIERVGRPVVSVGNLTLGGTGKSPLVTWLASWLESRGVRPAVVSRGYGARRGTMNDEALELAQRLPGIVHVQNPNRAAAARSAIERHGAGVIVADDAFQHRRLHRDLDIVLLDALEPFGFDRVFPRGMLREPVEGLGRADAVVLTRADMIDAAAREPIRLRAAALSPQALWLEAAHAPRALVAVNGEVESLRWLEGRAVAAFCGIGNPTGFLHTLTQCGCHPTSFTPFADHHAYLPRDLERLERQARREAAEAMVCTEKDLVKLRALPCDMPLWAVRVGLTFLGDASPLEARLDALLAAARLP